MEKSKQKDEKNHEQKNETPIKETKKSLSRKVKILIFVCIILIILVAFFVFSKLRINISDEITVKVQPLEENILARTGEKITLNFSVKNENYYQCNAECNMILTDASYGKIISNTTSTFDHKETKIQSYEISLPKNGEGQLLYEFKATCHNIKSIICITNQDARSSISVANIKYSLSEDEMFVKKEYKTLIENFIYDSKILKETISDLKEANRQIPVGIEEFLNANQFIEQTEKEIAEFDKKSHELENAWNNEQYLQIKELLLQEDIEKLNKDLAKSEELINTAITVSKSRKNIIETYERIESQKQKLNLAKEFLLENKNDNNNQLLTKIDESTKNINHIIKTIKNNAEHSESNSSQQMLLEDENIKNYIIKHHQINQEISSLNIILENMLAEKQVDINSSKESCELLTEKISKLKQNSIESQKLLDIKISNMSEIERKKLMQEINQLEIRFYEKTGSSNLFNKTSNSTQDINHIEENINNTLIIYLAINTTILEDKKDEFCYVENHGTPSTQNIDEFLNSKTELQEINYARKSIIVEKTALKENKPICCIDANCQECCEKYSCINKKNPIIFVHGHAFNDQSSPENSLAIFNKIQERMKEENYVSMGQLDLQRKESYAENLWASYSKTPTTKASYYYITHYSVAGYDVSVKNQDGIENYAIRLKEIIDEVKSRTGNDKVTIVAHSMGGLVAREYIHLFGENSVDKIITINTPHKGVSGRVKELCTLFGAKKECEDLAEDSILLGRLNSPKNKVNIPIYAIRTTGCIMDNGQIGDGVVTNNSAVLDNAVNIEIKGNCTDTLQSDLHNNALDPDKYPFVYEKILDILDE